ncbi:crooked neck-like protein 1, partial [Tanacetum coccineum]
KNLLWQRLALREDGEYAEHGNGQEDESAPTDGPFFYDDKGIDTAYETEYDVQSSEDVGTDDDDVDKDFLVDEENETVEPDVDVYLFSISMDLPFDNIGVTNLVSDDVLEGEDVDAINMDGFDSDPGNDEEKNYRNRRIRAICDGKVLVFTMSQGTGPTSPNRGMEVGPSGSSGLTTNSKKRKNTCTNDDSQASSFVLDAHDKGDLCPWVLEIKHCTYKFLSEKIFEQVRVNSDILVKAVQDQLQCRAKSDLLLNNIYEVFNGKIVGGRDKPVITLLEYIREYCMKRIVNVQGVTDKYTGPLTPTATRIMESIKKEAHLINVQWNGANKYQVSGSLGDQCVVDVVSMTCSCRKWELTGIPCKHVVAACWNMALNDRAAPPQKLRSILVIGRPRKKRKRSKHEDEPFVKDGKLSRKGRTITCQSCGNTGHNKATCKGQGRKATTGGNNAEASGSVSGQAQQIEPVVGQDGLGRSGAGAVIGLSAGGGEGGAGVASQGSSHSRWTKRIVQTERISPQKRTPTQPAS